MSKKIIVKNMCVDALIDTGSQVTVMREEIYNKIESKRLLDTTICLAGFGKNEDLYRVFPNNY